MSDPVIFGAGPGDARVLCIVIHGRGQTTADMMASVVGRLDAPGVRYVLPKSEGAAWYAARAVDPLTDATAREMDAGLWQIGTIIAQERDRSPDRPLMLCGFSQGACMAVEMLMRHPNLAQAAGLLTGCRVGTGALPLLRLDGLPVYATCGDADPWIPLDAHHRMLADLTGAGARLRADLFPGRPHEVTETEIAVLSGMLTDLARRRPLLAGAV